MRRIHQIFFFVLLFTYSSCNLKKKYYSNRTNSSSTSAIYQLVQARRAAARLAKLARSNHSARAQYFNYQSYTVKTKIYQPADLHKEYIIEGLKIKLISIGIALVFMIIVISLCICLKRYADEHPQSFSGPRQSTFKPQSGRYTYVIKDDRNFQRIT